MNSLCEIKVIHEKSETRELRWLQRAEVIASIRSQCVSNKDNIQTTYQSVMSIWK